MRAEVAARVAAHFRHRGVREYARWKLRTDPVYDAVVARLRGRTEPVFDVGCGIGLLALCLRAEGIDVPIVGIDSDERKIAVGSAALAGIAGVQLRHGDAREFFPPGHSVVLLDVLQYFTPAGRAGILKNAREAVPAGGLLIVRSGLRDGSWRYRLTWTVDFLTRLVRWMSAERLRFPTREEIIGELDDFSAEVTPCWGRTPYNNYLFVFRKR